MLTIRMACHVDRKRTPGVRALIPTPSWDPKISSDGFVFYFLLPLCVRAVAVLCFFCFPFAVLYESLVRVGLFLSVSLLRPVGLWYPVPGFVLTGLGFPF